MNPLLYKEGVGGGGKFKKEKAAKSLRFKD